MSFNNSGEWLSVVGIYIKFWMHIFLTFELRLLMFVDATITLAIMLYKLSPPLTQFKFLHKLFSTGVAGLASEQCPGI
jgi:hypothetical protein